MSVRKLTSVMHAADVLVIAYAVTISAVALVFAARVPDGMLVLLANAGICAVAVCLAWFRCRTDSTLVRHAHDWYVAPVVFYWFTQLHTLVGPIHRGRIYDDLLIAADRWLFGVDPTVWLSRYSSPLLTEILQIAYTSFYVLFFLLGIELARRRDSDAVHIFLFTVVYGFLLSYLGYFLLPAVGPRFTLHDFGALNEELPGVLLTPALRWFVNTGGSVPMYLPNDAIVAVAQRDAFPSGHTMMTLVLMVLGFRFRARVRFVLLAAGTLLIVATVYQRYHYVVDLLAGAAFAAFCLLTAEPLYRRITRLLSPSGCP